MSLSLFCLVVINEFSATEIFTTSLRGTKITERSELINSFKNNNALIIPDMLLSDKQITIS